MKLRNSNNMKKYYKIFQGIHRKIQIDNYDPLIDGY